MADIDWDRVEPLLDRLLDLPRGEREAFVAERCGGDRDLERRLLDLVARGLDSHFLEPPPSAFGRTRVGERVGPYRLIDELGRGGMGVVWLAERDDGFRQRVALKIIKLGMGTDEVVRRFRRERQLLADLDHPGIVRLLDGGTTEDGLPYLALEVVHGARIDEHCKVEGLPLSERLQLFAQICEAIESAHKLGIVHRDLKPSNILVTSSGKPKVLDFGIAKVLSDDGPEQSLLTHTGDRLLTPRYAAPEQVQGAACTPATDVYSLGVVLYELLCERSPYGLDTVTPRDLESAICGEIPRRPSHFARGATGQHLAHDLDVIALRALAKDPARRYRDAGGLARDVRRHLAHEPIQARPDSTLYRVSKYVRRNRLLVGSALGIILALVIGFVVALVQYARLEREHEETEWTAYVSAVRQTETAVALGHNIGIADQHRPEFHGWEWQHMIARSEHTQRVVHELGSISQLDLDSTGRTLAAGKDNEILLIDVASGEITKRIATESVVTDIAFSPDGTLIASSHRQAVRVHDLRSGAKVHEWPAPGLVKHIRFHPDGRRIAAAHSNEAVTLHSLDDPDTVRELVVVKGIIRGIRFSPSGDRIAVAAVEHIVLVGIDDPGLDAKLPLTDQELSVAHVAFSHAGRYIAGIDMGGTVRIWDLTTGLPVAPPRQFGGSPVGMAFLHDRDELAIGRIVLHLWDLDSGREQEIPGAANSIGWMVAHPEKPLLYSSGWNGSIYEWDARAEQVPRHQLSDTECGAISVHPDGQSYSVVLDDGNRLARVALASGVLLAQCASYEGLRDLLYVPGAPTLVVARAQGLVVLNGETLATLTTVPLEEAECLVLTPDGERLVVGTELGRLVTVDPSSWSITEELDTDFEAIQALAFSPDGDELVVGGKAGPGVAVLRVADGRLSPVAGGTAPDDVRSAAFSPDGSLFAVGSSTRLRVWSARGRSLVHESPLHRVHLAFPEGSERLIASSYGSIVVLDTRRWDQLLTFRESRLSISDMILAPDGRTLLTADWTGDVLIWNAVPLPDANGH